MPVVSRDWRSPGEKWIRTDFGWRRLVEIRNSLHSQILRQLSQSSSSSKTYSANSSRKEPRAPSPSRSSSEDYNQHGCKNTSQVTNQSIEMKKLGSCSYKSEEMEKRLGHLHLLLSQRCVSARLSSKESSHYSTVTDAISKLNFEQALQDHNCFPFICKVVTIIYKVHQRTLSGSQQASLLRITDRAKNISTESHQHSGLVLIMIDTAISSFEKVRRDQFTGYGVRNVDTKLKSLIKMKRQLQSHQANNQEDDHAALMMIDLPSDCVRHIVAFLTHPRDVLNFGETNSTFHSITEENRVWRDLTTHHYGEVKYKRPENDAQPCWKDTFVGQYRKHGGQLKSGVSTAVCQCTKCNFVYWKSYGHPCSAGTDQTEDESSCRYLSTEQFLSLFVF